MRYWRLWGFCFAILFLPAGPPVKGDQPDPGAAERGKETLTSKGLLGPAWKDDAYQKVGKFWGENAPDPEKEPDAYAESFRRRYGLNSAVVPNDNLPMGLKRGVTSEAKKSGIQVDCLMCHGGSIGGTTYVGLGNTQIDAALLFEEMARADGRFLPPMSFAINTSRGTVNAGMFSAVLLSLRNTNLSRRLLPLRLDAQLPELDTPPWWNLAKKKTMYYDGRTPADSVRSNMQFLLGEKSLVDLKKLEPTFREILAYFKSLTPPKYPFAIETSKAQRGQALFEANCAKCHGTYGDKGEYPNEIVDLDVIGTDPARAHGLSDKLVAHYNATWLGENHPANPVMTGYQAPPLDGIWATAPYLHNGSVPTIYNLLKSSTRPTRFKRPPSTDFRYYDIERVGWTFETVQSSRSLNEAERRFTFDSARFGLGNGGHRFGDKLTEDERMDVIEYLKTL